MKFRLESDSMGQVRVPNDCYWGAQTQRSLENFKIGDDIFPREFIKAFSTLKLAAASVNKNFGLLTNKKFSLIEKVCNEIIDGKLDKQFPLVIFQTGSGTQTNMNINEVIANRSNEIDGQALGAKSPIHPNDDVNKSQSSNDTFPTAMHIASAEQINHLLMPSLGKLISCLEGKSGKYKNLIKCGRTHLQDAVPLTLGQEISGWISQLKSGFQALENTLPHLYELAIGGTAVGTGINSPKDFADECASMIAELTGLPFVSSKNKFSALAGHEALVQVSGALKGLAVTLLKIANDIRWMASGPRCGLGEITIPENEPGSSIMPGKVNPTQCEAITMVCCQVMGNDNTIGLASSQGNFELNVFKPVIIYNLLKSIRLLGDSILSFTDNCVAGIEPVPKKLSYYMENSLMLVTSLVPHIGYEKAADIARKAHQENITLKESAIQSGFVNEDEFNKWVNPAKMIGPTEL
jgi:fumarate hydratase class II